MGVSVLTPIDHLLAAVTLDLRAGRAGVPTLPSLSRIVAVTCANAALAIARGGCIARRSQAGVPRGAQLGRRRRGERGRLVFGRHAPLEFETRQPITVA